MYKSEKGVTFMVLVITVIVLILIGSAAAGAAISTYKESKVKVYIKEMDIVKEKLSLYEEKTKLNSSLTKLDSIGSPASENATAKEILVELENESGVKKLSSVDENATDRYKNYRLLTASDVTSILGIQEVNKSYMFDVLTKEVYTLTPISYEKDTYYSADDIRGK